jgi:hypothetical protein
MGPARHTRPLGRPLGRLFGGSSGRISLWALLAVAGVAAGGALTQACGDPPLTPEQFCQEGSAAVCARAFDAACTEAELGETKIRYPAEPACVAAETAACLAVAAQYADAYQADKARGCVKAIQDTGCRSTMRGFIAECEGVFEPYDPPIDALDDTTTTGGDDDGETTGADDNSTGTTGETDETGESGTDGATGDTATDDGGTT